MAIQAVTVNQELAVGQEKRAIKIKWRQHEAIFVFILLIVYAARYMWDMLMLTEQQLEGTYIIPYNLHHVSFKYHRNVLLPKIGIVLTLCLAYYGINWVIIPILKRISFRDTTTAIFRKIILAIVAFYFISWMLALGINTVTYYGHPWFFSYGGFQLLGLFGYNDHPLQDLWFGVGRALWFVFLFTVLGGLREVVIYYLERPGSGRSYRILVVNQLTMGALVYFTLFTIILQFNIFSGADFRITYAGFIPATFLTIMVNLYWLFPQKEAGAFFHFRTLIQLLLSTFLCSLLFFLFDGFAKMPSQTFTFLMICWGGQLFVTTPISWFIYQQRKDRILQLRGLEERLSKSQADLQFLRSQINPHFLFNALNTLYGTALREKAPDTASGIQQLGDMMRFMLHENHLDLIPMNKEIEYLRHYIALQSLRIQASPDITVEAAIPEQPCDHQIAPMLLIPFVENAFKHGISLREKSWINISLTCDEKQIQFTVRNSVHVRPEHDPEKEQSGIGLKNVQERLKLVYPDRHTIDIQSNEREFVVQLAIRS